MRVQVFEVISRKKIVGVLETGGIGEINIQSDMCADAYKEMCKSNIFGPRIGTVSDDIVWDSLKKSFQCSRFYM